MLATGSDDAPPFHLAAARMVCTLALFQFEAFWSMFATRISRASRMAFMIRRRVA